MNSNFQRFASLIIIVPPHISGTCCSQILLVTNIQHRKARYSKITFTKPHNFARTPS